MAVTTKLSADEFEISCHEYGPCELVRGEIVQLAPGAGGHSRLSTQITYLLEKWARESSRGRVFTNEAGLIVEREPDTVRGADAAYFSFERLPKNAPLDHFLATPPELVVEIIGKGQSWRSMVKKAGEYLAMGVDLVWIIDPRTKRVHIHLGDDEPTIASTDDVLADSKVLPGFSCTVNELFEE
jgi:Uma2 family endonuclease